MCSYARSSRIKGPKLSTSSSSSHRKSPVSGRGLCHLSCYRGPQGVSLYKSLASIAAECNAIFHFCEMNDLVLNKKKIKRFLPPDESSRDDRLYTDIELQRIIAACNKREKVMILLLVSGGIRIGALSKLKVKDLEPIHINNNNNSNNNNSEAEVNYDTYKITLDGDSKHERYLTTCNRECVVAIQEYLQQREKDGEGPVKETSPLIREHRDPRDIFRMASPRLICDDAIRYAEKF